MALQLPVSAPKPPMPLKPQPGVPTPLRATPAQTPFTQPSPMVRTQGAPGMIPQPSPPSAIGIGGMLGGTFRPAGATPPSPSGAPLTQGMGTAYAPGVNTYATNPNSDLRGQTITPGPMANRMDIANTYEQNWNRATEPQFQADLRSATSQAAGAGQLGSGQLRTSLGNLAYNRDLQRNTNESNFLNNALSGSIEDAYRNIQQADQQQAFQAGLQGQTFNEGLQSLLAGNSGNPADTQLALSGIYANNANQAGQGLSNLIGNTVSNNTNQATLQQILQQLGSGGTPRTPLPTGTPIFNTGTQYGGVTG